MDGDGREVWALVDGERRRWWVAERPERASWAYEVADEAAGQHATVVLTDEALDFNPHRREPFQRVAELVDALRALRKAGLKVGDLSIGAIYLADLAKRAFTAREVATRAEELLGAGGGLSAVDVAVCLDVPLASALEGLRLLAQEGPLPEAPDDPWQPLRLGRSG